MKIRALLLLAPLTSILHGCGPADPPPRTTTTTTAPTPKPAAPAPAAPTQPTTAPADHNSPAAITAIYLDNMERGDWAANSDLFHLESLTEFRKAIDFLETEGNIPGTIQARAAFLGPGTTAQAVAALTNKELHGRVMTSLMGSPQSLAAIVASKMEVVGTVPDGIDRAHVVIRLHPRTPVGTTENFEIVTCKKEGTAWKVTLSGTTKTKLFALRHKIASTQDSSQKPSAPAPQTTPTAPSN